MKMTMNKIGQLSLILFVMTALVVSCGSTPKKNTIGKIKYTPQKKEEKIEFEKMDHEKVREEYQELLDLFEDKNLKEQIERRIANVYMMEGIQDQLESRESQSYYREAIRSYKEILEKYPNSPDNAEVLYQLAKAYDMEGRQEEALTMLNELTYRHPDYANNSEAYFRKGDIYFNKGIYKKAEISYFAVTKLGNEKLNANAHYMLGWSYYKQFKFEACLTAFAYVLGDLLSGSLDIESLDKTNKLLVKDTIHSISLALSKNGGASAIESTDNLANKPYVWMIYDDLGEYYLEKERYEDSAATFRQFVTTRPNSAYAPELHERLISTYVKGGFPRQAMLEKENFVASYGIYSKYKGSSRDKIAPVLKAYLDELAKMYHSSGQSSHKVAAQLLDKSGKPKDKKKYMELDAKGLSDFDRAAGFYQQYIDTFPMDNSIGEMIFLKAEARFSARRFIESIEEYEKVAYDISEDTRKQRGPTAGYAAIISYQKLIETLDKEKDVKRWQAKAVESMLRFAEAYHQDERSPSVLTNAAEYLFGLDQYERALSVSQQLIDKNTDLDKTLKKTAYGIMAHSFFKLGRFAQAEQSYFSQRALVEKGTGEYTRISEQLANSIYKKSEIILSQGDKADAVAELLKIKSLTPSSKVRVTAQYDAATILLELNEWKRAIVELIELSERFSDHSLALEFPRKLAFSYEKDQQWEKAALSYLYLFKNDSDQDVKREALFIAGDMYERNGDFQLAIDQFKKYAYTYEQPFGNRMEARYRLALNYRALEDKNKELYWLRRVIAGDKEAGNQRNARSRWLAAWANIQYGDYFAWEFERKKLRLPLNKSLPAKNKALQDATGRYQMAADYGILEFVTMSSYKIAGLYEAFALELRKSPTPKGLSSSDKQFYAEIIEEQASPFVDLATDLYQGNVERAWAGKFNEWIEKSFTAMKRLNPDRFGKVEVTVDIGEGIR